MAQGTSFSKKMFRCKFPGGAGISHYGPNAIFVHVILMLRLNRPNLNKKQTVKDILDVLASILNVNFT